ncbi:MAG: M20 family metallo-hydrolase [Bacteroidaceae bacterium]|nr:M20 family metallo-hydrolase [Bacteroidaceae bacterium]
MAAARLNAQDAVQLLEKLIAIPSVSRNEAQTAQMICSFLRENGVQAAMHFNNVWAKAAQYDSSKPTLLLNSHHDTVKPSSAYTHDPFRPFLQDGKLFGLGSNDAGASVVSLLVTFCNFYDASLPFNLLLDISAEEEVMGEHGIRAMVPFFQENNIPIDMALVGEPTGMDAAVGERGLVVLDCTAHGKQGHAARNEGINAIYKAIADIEKLSHFHFDRVSSLLGDIKLTTTQIEAGVQHNVVPDTCKFVVDVRTTDAYTNEEVVELLQQALDSDVVPRSTRIRASAIPETHPMVQAALRLGRKTYVSPTTSDMALMPFTSMKMGVGQSSRSHSADEFVLVNEIVEGVEIYDKYIKTLADIYETLG